MGLKIFILIVCFLLVCIFIGYIYEIWEARSIRKMVSNSLFDLMEIHYYGTFNSIRRNQDMFCTYVFFIESYIPEDKRNNEVEIIFELKDKSIDKKKLCFKYLSLPNDKDKFTKFIKKYYNFSVNIK